MARSGSSDQPTNQPTPPPKKNSQPTNQPTQPNQTKPNQTQPTNQPNQTRQPFSISANHSFFFDRRSIDWSILVAKACKLCINRTSFPLKYSRSVSLIDLWQICIINNVIKRTNLLVYIFLSHPLIKRTRLGRIERNISLRNFLVFFVCIFHWYFTMSNIFILNITLSSEFWIYMFMSVWRICRRL